MNVLSGKYDCTQYEGEIYIEGNKQFFTSVAASKAAGIEMVYQELNVLYDSSIAENIFVGTCLFDMEFWTTRLYLSKANAHLNLLA